MARKNVLSVQLDRQPDPPAPAANTFRARSHPLLGSDVLKEGSRHRPVGAVAQVLSEASEKASKFDALQQKLTEGFAVVELEPDDVEASFMSDRMRSSSADLAEFTEQIKAQGQLVPALVRPHPNDPSKYQLAFGHRRWKAAAALGRKLRAVVRDLSDEQLVVAQGQENSARIDLTFVERARFAARLSNQFGRSVAIASLGIEKTNLSKILQAIENVSEELIDRLGPVPSAGLRSWAHLSELLDPTKFSGSLNEMLSSPEFDGANSDERFRLLVAELERRKSSPKPEAQVFDITGPGGARVGKISVNERRVSVVVDRQKEPEFAEFVRVRLTTLREEFEKARAGAGS